jgi:hypothetical protein
MNCIMSVFLHLQKHCGVLVIAHCTSTIVSRTVFDWAHTYDFYVAEDWFGMNDLDLLSHVVPSSKQLSISVYIMPSQ